MNKDIPVAKSYEAIAEANGRTLSVWQAFERDNGPASQTYWEVAAWNAGEPERDKPKMSKLDLFESESPSDALARHMARNFPNCKITIVVKTSV
jgi:hypothetical protein